MPRETCEDERGKARRNGRERCERGVAVQFPPHGFSQVRAADPANAEEAGETPVQCGHERGLYAGVASSPLSPTFSILGDDASECSGKTIPRVCCVLL